MNASLVGLALETWLSIERIARLAPDKNKNKTAQKFKSQKRGMVRHCCKSTAKPDSVSASVLVLGEWLSGGMGRELEVSIEHPCAVLTSHQCRHLLMSAQACTRGKDLPRGTCRDALSQSAALY